MKILIVDDNQINVKTFSAYCQKKGHEVLTAPNGLEAIKSFMKDGPDLILMDIMMPLMDGFEATKEIKALSRDRWIPILLVNALNDTKDLIKGLKAGADDYLPKPVDLTVLGEKIKVMEKILGMYSLLTRTIEELKEYQEEKEEELQLAKHLMDKIIRVEEMEKTPIQMWIKPAERLCGDAVASAQTPGGILQVMVADGTGHGLSAAISVMPAIDVFYAMTAKGYSIPGIVEELNRKVRLMLPRERFLATIFISVDWLTQSIRVWNGGGPDVYLVGEFGKILKKWKSNHLPLGVAGDQEVEYRVDAFQWNEPAHLYICSDGLLDARGANGESFGEKRFLDTLLIHPPEKGFERLKTNVLTHLEGEAAHDDISLVVIRCQKGYEREVPKTSPGEIEQSAQSSHWGIGLSLNAFEIRTQDVIPFLMRWLEQTRISFQIRTQFFSIISELYNNAVDHGILGLESYIKLLPNGFEKYMDMREEGLSELKEGTIDIHLERIQSEEGDFLRLKLKDSGPGFDFKTYTENTGEDNFMPAWRGIAMVNNLCKKMEYLNSGNEVVVEYGIT